MKTIKKLSFEEAKKQAKALRKRMGGRWQERIWENLGWHYCIELSAGDWWFTIGAPGACAEYWCMASTLRSAGSPGWYDDRTFDTPEQAFLATLAIFNKKAMTIAAAVKKVNEHLAEWGSALGFMFL